MRWSTTVRRSTGIHWRSPHRSSRSPARGLRRTTVVRETDGILLAEIQTEWVWIRLADGRPARVPKPMLEYFSLHGGETSSS
jgi:hypothetical protein